MQAILDEVGHATVVPFSVIAIRILLAAVLGAIIGFEREWRNHSAGLRTHIMVCVAACVFGILTMEIALSPVFAGREGIQFDPIRAVEAVTAGVAFLAAGLIWAGRGKVHGLTTGAGLWLAGAIGLASGLGLWQIALLGTVIAILVLGVLGLVTERVNPPDEPDADAPRGVAPPKAPNPGGDASQPLR